MANVEVVKPSNDWSPTIKNTLLCAGAVSFLYGPVAALTCAAVNVVFARWTDPEPWFATPDEKVYTQIKGIWEEHHFFKIQIIVGIAMRALGAGINQTAIEWIKNSFSPLKMLIVLARLCVLAPFLEETIFRGFFQEKLQNVQAYVFGEKESNSELQKMIRIFAQAIVFGMCHYHPSQGASNKPIMLATGFTGLYLGDVKEKNKNLWSSSFLHAYINASVVARVCLFGV